MHEKALPEKASAPIVSVKGFERDMTCRGFQFEVGKTYSVGGKIVACENGFHAIEGHPLEVFGYYPPATSVYHLVEQCGDLARHSSDSKLASAEITIRAELTIPALVVRAWDFVWSRAKIEEGGHATGYQGAASATGNRGAASATGYQGAASATGNRGAASATGYQGAASATGELGAASATGNRGAASATGNRGAASATGKFCSALGTGIGAKVSGSEGSALHLDERIENYGAPDHGKIIATWSSIVGQNGIKPGVFYTLRDGKPVEVQS